jgi:acyl-coenzyme A synthetase/AMP-(fatty) acid ligase
MWAVVAESSEPAKLMAWVAERVASYKRIREVEFTDGIPKSPSGKILRRLLVGQHARPVRQP